MSYPIDDRGLAAFAAVVQQQGFERAAKSLNLTQSAVSQRVKGLEQRLGQVLLVRSNPPKPTETGTAVLKYAQQVQHLQAALQQSLALGGNPQQRCLALAVNADSLGTWLPEALAPWCEAQRVTLRLSVADQDTTHQWLDRGDVVGCISAKPTASSGCEADLLGYMRYLPVASPDFVARYFPQGMNRASMAKAPTVVFDAHDKLQHDYLHDRFELDGDAQAKHWVPSSEGFVQWIELGMGFGLLPEKQASPGLQNGALVLLGADHFVEVPLYWHRWALHTPLLYSLGNALAKGALQALDRCPVDTQ